MSSKKTKRGLGRGLAALIGEARVGDPAYAKESNYAKEETGAEIKETPKEKTQTNNNNEVVSLGIDRLVAGVYQPRRAFDEEAIAALAASFRQNGILQPLIVRPRSRSSGENQTGGDYEIVAGERRWRAAQAAQLHEVPVIVRTLSDVQALEIGLIENVQREGLNPIEEAEGYRRLAQEFHYTQSDIAEIVGKSRSHITNMLRVLDAPPLIRDYVIAGKLTAGHARALVGAPAAQAETLARQVVAQALNVRATESLVAKTKTGGGTGEDGGGTKDKVQKSVDILALEKKLTDTIGLSVHIEGKQNTEHGAVKVSYKSLEQFDDIVKRLLSAL